MPLSIRYYGLFELEPLIKVINDWIETYNFDIDKKKVTKKEKTPGEYELELECSRSVTAYAKYKVKIKLSIRNMFDVTLKKNDETKEMKKGSVDVDVDKEVEIDYDKYFTDHPILSGTWNLIKDFFKNIFYGEKKQISDRLDEIVDELMSDLRKALGIKTY